ncbi:CDP-alcohol phosphatidyltransferase-domain-containing protein [Lentinula aciculospora]|uniref:CDP-alcohol phosphatidyltransferase-domain-containing protein n=1 Tax=Lentinula aciculospora TaxID=153920 RepID=A0A9W9DKH0_9AGAR|nr:CDP-alcohol phosphatidyltransferase-domain-containing protein [Lentinula aciculospora]
MSSHWTLFNLCYNILRRSAPGEIHSMVLLIFFSRSFSCFSSSKLPRSFGPSAQIRKLALRENIYTIPNFLTASRILACPAIGWSILQGQFDLATSLLVYAGLTDLADGWIARRFKMQSVLGTVLDPAADKALMTTLTVTLSMKGMLPIPLAVLILSRDVLLSLSAFYIRYTSLPPPKTFSRYWDFGIPSAEVHPTGISKVNTGLQLLLMGTTTISPLLPWAPDVPLTGLQWIVATTTIWSGISYVFAKDGYRVVEERDKDQRTP